MQKPSVQSPQAQGSRSYTRSQVLWTPLLVFFGNHNHPITEQLRAEMLSPKSIIEKELAAGGRMPRTTGAARVERTRRLQPPPAATALGLLHAHSEMKRTEYGMMWHKLSH